MISNGHIRTVLLLGIIALILPVNKTVMPALLGITFLASLLTFRNQPDLDSTAVTLDAGMDSGVIEKKMSYGPKMAFAPLYVLAGIFLLHIAGLGYTDHWQEGQKELEYKLSYLAFAVISFGIPRMNQKELSGIFDLFSAGSVAFAIGSVAWGALHYVQTGSTEQLSYGALSHPFHPTYMAMYHTLSMVWLMKRIHEGQSLLMKRICLVMLAISAAYIMLLASKAGILGMAMAVAFGSWYFVRQMKWKDIVLPLFIIGLSAGLSFWLIPTSSERIDAALQTVSQGTSEADRNEARSSVKLRQVVWKASLEIIAENPFGVGTGDTTPELIKKYNEMGESYASEKQLNCHNQFLQVTCEHGWPALILLLTGMTMLAYRAWKQRNLLFAAFLSICAMNFMFESCLEVQAGIVFFFFFSLVFLSSNRQTS